MRYTVGKTKKQKSLVLSLLNPTMVGRYRYKVLENVGGGKFSWKTSKKWYKIDSVDLLVKGMVLIVFKPHQEY